MEDNRKEVDPSGQELIEGEQNGQTAQPLVANQNDQNVKSLAGTKRARNPGKDKKYRAKKKQEIEDTERQLKKVRADYDKLKISHAYISGKLDQAQKDWELITRGYRKLQQVVERQNAWIDMHQQLLVGGTINQFGATMESGGPVFEESFPQSHQVERAHWNNVEQPGLTYGGLNYGGDLNYTSLLGAAMASGSSPMQGSLAPGGQGNNSEQPTPYNADQFPGVN